MVSRWFSLGGSGRGNGPERQTQAQPPRAPIAPAMLKAVRRVLVLAPEDPGLLLLTTPALRHVRRSLPHARIDLVGGKAVGMLAGTGIADRLHDDPGAAAPLAGSGWPWRRGPDLLLDYRERPTYERRRARRQAVLATNVDATVSPHDIRHRLALLDGILPPYTETPAIEIGFGSDEERWATQLLQDDAGDAVSVLLHVTPDLPMERWEALARGILEIPETRLFVAGETMRLPLSSRCQPLGAVPNEMALAAFVGRVDLLVCGVCLPMHMTGATETPSVLLMTADDAIRLVPLAGDPALVVAPAGAALVTLPERTIAAVVTGAVGKAIDRQQRRFASRRRALSTEAPSLMRRPDDAPKQNDAPKQ